MALRFIDSFDHYNTSQINRKWSDVSGNTSISSSNPRTGASHLRLLFSSAVTKTFDDRATWIVGFALNKEIGGMTNSVILQFRDSNTTQCSLRLNGDLKLEVLRGAFTSVTDGISSLSLSAGIYYYIEMKVTIANSIGAGTCEVRVNGATWITVATGQDLQSSANATAGAIRWTGLGVVVDLDIDDLYICDDSGSINNDFLGDQKIEVLLPDGNGTTSDFTGHDANQIDNYLNVDENPADDDTSWNENNTVGEIDLYTFGNISGTPSAIQGVQVNQVVKKDDAGSRTIRAVARPTSTNFFGDPKSPSTGSYTDETHIWEQNPQTDLDWTQSNLDATQFGIEIET